MNLELFYWLGPLIVLLVGSGLTKGRVRDVLFNSFLGLLTAFVVSSTYSMVPRSSKLIDQVPILDLNKVEMQLRVESALATSDQIWEKILGKKRNRSGVFGLLASPKKESEASTHFLSIKYLEDALKKHKDSTQIKLRLALVLLDDPKSDFQQAVILLKQIEQTPKIGILATCLQQIASGEKPETGDFNQAVAIAQTSLPKGWFQEEALIWLFSSDKNSPAYKNMKLQIADNSVGLLFRVLGLMLGALGLGLVGVIVLAIELFRLSRKPLPKTLEPKPWSAKLTYLIFLSWMASQIIVGKLVLSFIQPISPVTGPWAAISVTGLLYFCSNLPGMLLIYFLALRPYKLSFADGVGLRLSSPGYSFLKLCGVGILAWCTLFPIILSTALLMKNSGSSNPMMTIAMEIGRRSDIGSVVFLILVVSVLAPLCEEILFRGFLFQALERWFGTRSSIFLSSLAFAAIHMDPNVILQLFCLGYVFAVIFARTRSLLPSMIAHGLWNSCVFIVSWSVLST